MSAVMHLPIASASIELEHVIVDGSEERAVLAVCSEPQRSAFVRAVNSHDEMLKALRYVETRCVSKAAYPRASIEDRTMRDLVVAAIAKAEGGAA